MKRLFFSIIATLILAESAATGQGRYYENIVITKTGIEKADTSITVSAVGEDPKSEISSRSARLTIEQIKP
jgi:hypothetical protein